MVRRFLHGERRVKPVRTMSVALGILGLLMGYALWNFMQHEDAPPLFKYALITLPTGVWCAGFFIAGVLIFAANLKVISIEVAHSFGAFIYTWFGTALTIAAANPGVVTSGYSFLCLIAAIAHWVCVAYWDWGEDAACRGVTCPVSSACWWPSGPPTSRTGRRGSSTTTRPAVTPWRASTNWADDLRTDLSTCKEELRSIKGSLITIERANHELVIDNDDLARERDALKRENEDLRRQLGV